MSIEEKSALDGAEPQKLYGAFVDVLGFGSLIQSDFSMAISTYKEVLSFWRWHFENFPKVRASIYSDAILLTSTDFQDMVYAIGTLNMGTLMGDRLLRGGIGYGSHVQVDEGTNCYVVSEALTDAAALEKSIKWPCVAISDKIDIADSWWTLGIPNIMRSLLYYHDMVIVNPLNVMWGTSAQFRAAQLSAIYPEHRDKYHWFLDLTEAIFDEKPLIPSRFLGIPSSTKQTAT